MPQVEELLSIRDFTLNSKGEKMGLKFAKGLIGIALLIYFQVVEGVIGIGYFVTSQEISL